MTEELSLKALELGFTAIGFSRPAMPLFFDEYRKWVSSGRNAGMLWMAENMEIRANPERLLAGCNTVISLAFPYPALKPATLDGYTLARYSTPCLDDYHTRLKIKCRELCTYLDDKYKGSASRVVVDTAPLLERSFAYSSGIGFIGKNNMLIIPGHGSYFYLAEILTTAMIDIPFTAPQKNLCGPCTACIDACPTGALKGANDFDASLCLSYMTIESKSPLSPSLGRLMNRCFLGCDACQEACPFNKCNGEIKCMPDTGSIMAMKDEDFLMSFGRTALSRPGPSRIRANIKVVCAQD
ncbi:MAG: tRNA epoxyqueuosine(34) reductase QueG [Deltaproteobacteria bacterium]|nr:tRNA epoxyqueuosine(34) reductase QueG [Deltaproteobacteria bacterium]